MIPVAITHIGQDYDLKTRSFDHALTLELPNGTSFKARVDESVVEMLMQALAGPVAAPPPPEDQFTPQDYDGEEVNVFGGQLGLEDAPAPPMPVQAAQPKIPRVVPPQPVSMRTVPQDEYGNPIVPGLERPDPGEMSEMDEDGVPQL